MAAVARTCAALAALTLAASCASAEAFADDALVPLADGSDESVAQAVESVTAFPDELDPRIWTDTQMKPDVREATLRVVDRIVSSSGIEGLTVDSVELFGSNASYEYDDTSDFGVHVFVHPAAMTPE